MGGRDVEAHVRDGGARAVGLERRLYDGLRPPERHGLRRDLRLRRAHLLGAAHAQPRLRQPLRGRDGARLLQRRALRPFARRDALLLREPAGEQRRSSPLDLASLPVLPDERRAPHRLGRRLFLQRRRRPARRAHVRRQFSERHDRRKGDSDQPRDELSLVRRRDAHDRSRRVGGVRVTAPRSGLGARGDACNQRRANGCQNDRRLSRASPPLDPRRPDKTSRCRCRWSASTRTRT